MKPTTQAKTFNQLCNQLEAMEQILASVMAGAADLGINRSRAKYARDDDPNLGEALANLRLALKEASSVAIDANTEVYRAKVRERNGKYSYLRTEYSARKATCSSEQARLMRIAEGRRQAVQFEAEREAHRKQAEEDIRSTQEEIAAFHAARAIELEDLHRRARERANQYPAWVRPDGCCDEVDDIDHIDPLPTVQKPHMLAA